MTLLACVPGRVCGCGQCCQMLIRDSPKHHRETYSYSPPLPSVSEVTSVIHPSSSPSLGDPGRAGRHPPLPLLSALATLLLEQPTPRPCADWSSPAPPFWGYSSPPLGWPGLLPCAAAATRFLTLFYLINLFSLFSERESLSSSASWGGAE